MRTCVWCGDPLPEPSHKGHRRREFCQRPKGCRQQHYLWQKQTKRDADALADSHWKATYELFVERYKLLEVRLQERLSDLEEARKLTDTLEEHVRHYMKRYEDLLTDYITRLKMLGVSEKDIEELNAYWSAAVDQSRV